MAFQKETLNLVNMEGGTCDPGADCEMKNKQKHKLIQGSMRTVWLMRLLHTCAHGHQGVQSLPETIV